jgi:dephospho-CoA kinase
MIQNKNGKPIKTIGLTGSIASGKTLITDYLRSKGAFVICADEVSREVVLPGKPGFKAIVKAFGGEYLLDDGSLDRKKLASRVFHDSAALEKLGRILHPVIKQAVLEGLRDAAVKTAIISAPLLIEAGWQDWMDEVWLVVADDGLRLDRIMKRDGLSKEEAAARMQAQMPQSEKKAYADVIIENSGELGYTLKQVNVLWEKANIKG